MTAETVRRVPEQPSTTTSHRDVTGGWLRPAVFGVMDGLVSNTALIAGVAGGGAPPRTVVLAGLAGLVAGAFSMATGEYVSVASQTELTRAEIEIEKARDRPGARGRGGRAGRASTASRGVDAETAARSPGSCPATPSRPGGCTPARSSASTPTTCPRRGRPPARRSSAFTVGALVPVLPYLLGGTTLLVPVLLALLALFVAGALVSRFTDRGALYSGGRQLLLGGAATALTYGDRHGLSARPAVERLRPRRGRRGRADRAGCRRTSTVTQPPSLRTSTEPP